MPAISIVIPTLGRSGTLGEVIAALGRQEQLADEVEVLVVLDAEAPVELPLGERPGALRSLKVLRAERAGASGARNTGWRAAAGPLILFLDDDIVPVPRLVAEHIAWHRRHPQAPIGVLGLVKWSPRVKLTAFMRWLDTGIQFEYGTIAGTEAEWTRFYSCNVSLKREMLALVGGFDEERFPYGYEDLELARRMSERGFRLMFNPAALGLHLKTETIDSWRRNLRRIAIAERRFTQLYPGERAYFYERFHAAAQAPAARGRSARLAGFVSPRLPWLGPFVWRSYDLVCSQRLAPEFLSEWDAAEAAETKHHL